MEITLTKEQEAAAERLVAAGLFATRDEAVARSLDWLQDEAEKYEAIRRELETSTAQSARGEARPLDPDALMQRVRERLEQERTKPLP